MTHTSERKTEDMLRGVSSDDAERFNTLGLSHVDRGILPSEMHAACAIMKRLGVKRIIESGRWLGFSTEALAAYFKDEDVHIDSIEFVRNERGIECEKRLAPYKKVRLYYGDAKLLLPGLLAQQKDIPTAILLDGPKGELAVRILKEVLSEYNTIVVAFIHDTYAGSGGRIAVEREFPDAVFTDDIAFLSNFSHLDKDISIGTVHPEKYSGTIATYPQKSYGPTLAIISSPFTGNPVGILKRILHIQLFWFGLLQAFVHAQVLRVGKYFRSILSR